MFSLPGTWGGVPRIAPAGNGDSRMQNYMYNKCSRHYRDVKRDNRDICIRPDRHDEKNMSKIVENFGGQQLHGERMRRQEKEARQNIGQR